MSTTESKVIEYRLVWPNGEVYEKASKAHVDAVQNNMAADLRNAGVPQEYWPRREARILVTMATEWGPYRDVEASFNNDEDEDEVDPISPTLRRVVNRTRP